MSGRKLSGIRVPRPTADRFKAPVCPHCGAVSVSLSWGEAFAFCWQGHKYRNVRPPFKPLDANR